MDGADEILIDRAEHQHGLVTRRQAVDAGLSDDAWRHRVRRGEWEPITRRVARRRGAPASQQQRAMAATLDVGPSAYLSHRCGVAHWGAPGHPAEPFDAIVLRDRQPPSPLVTVHRPRHLPDPFGAVLDGIPVVRPALALLQIAPLVHPERLRRTLDWFWSRRLLSGPSVRAELGPLLHKGRPGTVAMRELLESLTEDYVPPASALEGRFASILERAGLPPMRRQVDLGDERWCGRVDFLATDLPLVVEVDSETFHSALSSTADDDARQVRLEEAGFAVTRVSDHEVWHQPSVVVDRVRRARWSLRHRLAA